LTQKKVKFCQQHKNSPNILWSPKCPYVIEMHLSLQSNLRQIVPFHFLKTYFLHMLFSAINIRSRVSTTIFQFLWTSQCAIYLPVSSPAIIIEEWLLCSNGVILTYFPASYFFLFLRSDYSQSYDPQESSKSHFTYKIMNYIYICTPTCFLNTVLTLFRNITLILNLKCVRICVIFIKF
jgi:hypothetical protein